MKGPRPKRSVIFIWDSGEERGLWGTRQFVAPPPVPLDRIVAHVNVDMIGATRAPGTADAELARRDRAQRGLPDWPGRAESDASTPCSSA